MSNGMPFSYAPRGLRPDDSNMQRRSFRDNMRSPSPQINSSRPSGRNIYMQRKEYGEALNRQDTNFHVRAEHLFTCELDGQEVKTLDDCVAKLKRLDVKGRLWPQEMILEVQGGSLLLSDIETKSELESLPLTSVQQTKAVLDSCAYNSLLTVTVKDRNSRFPQVYIFQCEEVGAELLKNDLDKILQTLGDEEPLRPAPDIRRDLENIISHHASAQRWSPTPQPLDPQPLDPPPPWDYRDEDVFTLPRARTQQEYRVSHHDEPWGSEVRPPQEKVDLARNTSIINHVLDDMEIFMNKLLPAMQSEAAKGKEKKKLNGIRKSKKKPRSLPPAQEYKSCLQKVKYGLNVLGELEGTLENPSVPEYIHIIFKLLAMMLPNYPRVIPSIILAPVLTEKILDLLRDVVTPEEKQLWESLGDAWAYPRSAWQGTEIPPYVPVFYDGWQPPAPTSSTGSHPSRSRRPPDSQVTGSPRMVRPMQQDQMDAPRWSPSPPRASEPPLFMLVIYDFMARNNQELSVLKGEAVEVVQKSRQWWRVRNNRGEEGNVPQKVLEPMDAGFPALDARHAREVVTLDTRASPAEVKAWLQSKGFSRITISSLGVLPGRSLLGMSQRDVLAVCPEEGARVFFELQAVKSSVGRSGESFYDGRY